MIYADFVQPFYLLFSSGSVALLFLISRVSVCYLSLVVSYNFSLFPFFLSHVSSSSFLCLPLGSCKKSFMYTAVLVFMIASSLHSPAQDQSFTISTFMFLLSQIISLYAVSIFQNCSSYCLLIKVVLTSFIFYAIDKCLISYAEQGFQFYVFVCLLVMLFIALHIFVFLFQVEEHPLVSPVMQALWW